MMQFIIVAVLLPIVITAVLLLLWYDLSDTQWPHL